MAGFTVTVESTLREDWGKATVSLVRAVRAAVRSGAEEAVAEARRTHRYKDRTGNLTRSIHAGPLLESVFGAEIEIIAGAEYASFVEEGTHPHEILPRRAKMLHWEEPQGDHHFASKVNHPGTKPYAFMGDAYLKAERVIEREIEVAAARIGSELP
jgi:hypothetical protein